MGQLPKYNTENEDQSYTKKYICHFAICQNCCFDQFYHSKIEVLQIAQLLAKADVFFSFLYQFHSSLKSEWVSKNPLTKSEPIFIVAV